MVLNLHNYRIFQSKTITSIMVYINCVRFFFAFSAINLAVFSAAAQSGPNYTIEAKTIYDGHNVIVRWAPKDFGTWNWANFNNGYDIERTTIKENGSPLSTEAMLNSRITLATNLVP